MKTLTQFLSESKLPSTGDKELDTLLQKHQATGRVAYVYPIKKMVTLNGSRPISYQEAKKKLKD